MSVCWTLWNTEHDFSYTELKGNLGCRTVSLEYKFKMSVCREVEMSTALPALPRILLWLTYHNVQQTKTEHTDKILFLWEKLEFKTEKPITKTKAFSHKCHVTNHSEVQNYVISMLIGRWNARTQKVTNCFLMTTLSCDVKGSRLGKTSISH